MAKFPTEVERSVTVQAPIERAYAFFWDVPGSARCIPGIATCAKTADDTYCFVFQERSTGPVSMTVRYTAHYAGNGKDEIRFRGVGAADDNTDVDGVLQLAPQGPGATRVTLRQTIAPDTPVPRLLQGVLKGFVQKEADTAVEQYLATVKRALDGAS